MQLSLIPPSTAQLSLRPRRRVVANGRRLMVHLSDSIAYSLHLLKRRGKGGRLARTGSLYCGLSDLTQASALAAAIRSQFGAYVTSRPAREMPQTFELVIHGDEAALEAIATWVGTPANFDDSDFRKSEAAQHSAECTDWRDRLDRLVEFGLEQERKNVSTKAPLPGHLAFAWSRPNYCQVSTGGIVIGVVSRPKFAHLWSYKPTGGDWAGDCADWREAAIALDAACQNVPAVAAAGAHGFRVKMSPANPRWGEVFDGEKRIGEIWQSTDLWSWSVPGISPRWHQGGSKGQAIKAITDRAQCRSGGISIT